MRKPTGTGAIILVAALLAAACAETGDESDRTDEPPMPVDGEVAPVAAAEPDTTEAGVWAYLEDQDYRENWRLWPEKERLYTGTEPHGMLLTTYVNPTAYAAIVDGRVKDLPEGSIIVKENWMPDSTFDAATVMYKARGFNPEHQDWLFAKYDTEGTAEAFGRAEMCQACHQNAESGYIYTAAQQ